MQQNKQKNDTQEISNIRKKLLLNKRIIIQLVIIIASFVLIAIALWGLKDESQKDLRINFISGAAGLMAGAVISIADYFFLKKDEDDLVSQKENELSSKISDLIEMREKLDELVCGTKGIKLHGNRNSIDLSGRIREAKKTICIYVTNLDFLTNHFQSLIDAAKRGVSIKVLGLKPTNLFIATRFHELSKPSAESFFDEIRIHIEHLREKLQEANLLNAQGEKLFSDKFEVKLYTNQPTHMLFWFDDILIVSFILRQGRARERIHIEFDLSDQTVSAIAHDFVLDFDLTWGEADELTKSLMEQLVSARDYNLNSMEAQGIDRTINRYKLIRQHPGPKAKKQSDEEDNL